ncbi:MAG TPA: hypothetical protein DDW52_20510 [Planctomycetaceae bacterium]|nr:hypothetical protein [Planctomycetaceae bacterium]
MYIVDVLLQWASLWVTRWDGQVGILEPAEAKRSTSDTVAELGHFDVPVVKLLLSWAVPQISTAIGSDGKWTLTL